MKGLILCGGLGTRLRPLTYFTPKPMLKIAEKPVLEYIVEHLNYYGINEIIVNLHYKPDKIYKHFGNRLVYTYEPELLGEEGTIESIRKWFKNDYLVVQNGDTITNVSINEMMRISKGANIKYMDGDVYAGTRIIRPDYFQGQREYNYYSKEASWLDMGTFENLKKAENYVKKLDYLRELSDTRN